MRKFLFVCKYCDWRQELLIYSKSDVIADTCKKCKSRDVYVKDMDKIRIDGYKGCPPFLDELKLDWLDEFPTDWNSNGSD